MNEQAIEDLKQFIASQISQSEIRLDQSFASRIDKLEKKVGEGFAGVADTYREVLDNHEDRITSLEATA